MPYRGAANALLDLAQAVANATAAPLASSGGSDTAVPMVVVMVVGVTGAWAAYTVVGRTTQKRHLPEA
ncbi:hypothetical protein [Actinomyces wuliandei]|uniref:hypothetical protein n=1 Tax=Actinomyces wuliandei TaxID=2057743 RepID=UPI000FDBED38|nr:hypothetical protein [Actinomyces wuliandei]